MQIRAGTADQPHIAPVLESLRRVAATVAVGPVECRGDRAAIDTGGGTRARRGPVMAKPRATIAFIRGINLGPTKKVPMPALREALGAAGFDDVRTHLNSGNVIVVSATVPVGSGHGRTRRDGREAGSDGGRDRAQRG